METTKKCSQCGNKFQGRSNKIYCSDTCKMAAFKSGQTFDTSPIEEPKSRISNDNFSSTMDKSKEIALQIELRKLELAHIRAMAEIEAEEKEKDRYWELEKMQFQSEKEKQKLQGEIEELRKMQVKKVEEEVPIEVEDNSLLPEDLKEAYDDCVIQFLEWEGEKLRLSNIQTFREEIMVLGKNIKRFIKSENLDKDEVAEYMQLSRMVHLLDTAADKINRKSFLDEKATVYSLDEDWREELEESLD